MTYCPSIRTLIKTVFTISLLLSTTSSFAEEHPNIKRITLLNKAVALSSKNINAKVIRVTFPAGYKTPLHTHDGPGPRYVVKGKLKVEEDGNSHTYSQGEVFWESGLAMTVENMTAENAEIIIVEMAHAH